MTASQLSEDAVAESVSTTNIPSTEENVNTQNSVPENKEDAEYMSSVESGDMETAQRLVDEAAEVTSTLGLQKSRHNSAQRTFVLDSYYLTDTKR